MSSHNSIDRRTLLKRLGAGAAALPLLKYARLAEAQAAGAPQRLILFPMMFIKFGTVILYFMHLKFDNPLFKRVFLFGLFLAVIVFCIMLTTFNYWWDDYFRFLTPS